MSYKTPIYDYRAKDGLDPENPKKKVMGYELMAEFEAIAKEITEVEGDLDGHWVEKTGDVMTGTLDTPKLVAVDILAAEINADEIHAVTFHGNGEEITDIITDQLKDVNSEGAVRDDLLIFNGTLWEATDFAFIETALTFKGGIDLTNSAEYPADQDDGDLYIANEDGVVAAEWVGIAGTSVIAGNFVGWAESKGRWYLLGDLASAAVTRVAAGLGIDVDDSVPAEPVVSIDRTEVDTWYADLAELNDLQLEVEGNTAQIEINKDNIAENKTQIEINKGGISDNKTQIDINTGDIAGNTDQIEINKGNIATNTDNIADNAAQIAINKGNIATNTGDIADTNDRIDKLALNDLTDVDAALPNRLDYLVFNGTDWESEPIAIIDTELTYQGAIDMTGAAPASPANGDLYINDTDGVVDASWGVIGGINVSAGNVVGWADKTSRWYMMGDIASGSVTDVKGGYLINVDDSVPSQPVVNFDSVEADKIYLKIDDQFWKAVTGGKVATPLETLLAIGPE